MVASCSYQRESISESDNLRKSRHQMLMASQSVPLALETLGDLSWSDSLERAVNVLLSCFS